MGDEVQVDKSAEAREAVREFQAARAAAAEAAQVFAGAEARFKAATKAAAKKCENVHFTDSKGERRMFSKVRGGGYAFKPLQAHWTSEGKLMVDVSDIL